MQLRSRPPDRSKDAHCNVRSGSSVPVTRGQRLHFHTVILFDTSSYLFVRYICGCTLCAVVANGAAVFVALVIVLCLQFVCLCYLFVSFL